jgi:hypothetical protein
MANPNPSPDTRFGAARSNEGNAGGRTPSKWLRELLSASFDRSPGGPSRREKIGLHLIEVATSWKILHFGKDIEVASARDAVEAAKLLMAYDMGKPVNSVEVTSPDGSMSPSCEAASKTTSELRQAIAKALKIPMPVESNGSQPQEEKKDDVPASANEPGRSE